MERRLKLNNGFTVKVVSPENQEKILTQEADMDARVQQAVKSAIVKAKTCNKPIARYNAKSRKAYIEYADGTKKYAD